MNRKLLLYSIIVILCSLFVGTSPSLAQYWSLMDSGITEEYLWGVWGTSGTNVYAVGGDGNTNRCVILHYNGISWSKVECSTERLWDIDGYSSSEVYAVGSGGIVLKYDGINWISLDSGTDKTLYGIWVNRGNEVFAVGAEGIILHYNGSTWFKMESTVSESLLDVWGTSVTDVFAVGQGGLILHYDGTSWTKMNSGVSLRLSSVWGSSRDTIFAVGNEGTILKYDGSSWSKMNSGITARLDTVWGISGTDVFAAGEPSGSVPLMSSTILHYDGSAWSGMITPSNQFVYDIWGSSPSDIFAVGKLGYIVHYPSFEFIPHVTETIPMESLTGNGILDLTYNGHYLWGIDGNAFDETQYIVKINPSNGEIIESFLMKEDRFEAGTFGIAYGKEYLWVIKRDRIEAIDPTKGQVEQDKSIALDIGIPYGGAWDGNYLWFAESGTIYKVDVDSKLIVMEKNLSISNINDLEFARGFLWIVGKGLHPVPDAYLYKIDPETFDIVEQYNSGFGIHGIAYDGGSYLWVAEQYDLEYYKYDLGLRAKDNCPSETIYGTDSEQTQLLRSIRDNVLSKSPEGRELIRLYYQWSPAIVKVMEQDEEFKEDIKEIVDGFLGVVE